MEQQERILQVQECYSREHMDSIRCHFIYVNLENSIEKISTERIELIRETGKTVISSEQVLQLIQSNRISTPTSKYIFQESFLYFVDLESENLQQFIQGDNFVDISKRFFQVLPLLDDIVIPQSIFVFHHLNGLYFLFKETVNKQMIPKSILKKGQRSDGTRKKGMGISSIVNLENILFNLYSGIGGTASPNQDKIEVNNIFCQKEQPGDFNDEKLLLKKNKRVTMKLSPMENTVRRINKDREPRTTRNTRKNEIS